MKKFYKAASPVEEDAGYSIALDRRTVRTPMKALLLVPTSKLAEAIAGEWNAQEETLNPACMPLTGLANAMIDRIAPRRTDVIDELVRYLGSDMVCYRAEDDPLNSNQAAVWDPYINWFESQMGTGVAVTDGIMPVAQSGALLDAYRARLTKFSDAGLTAAR